ncbi:MAG: hypothetical protein KGR26_10405 [Cyanobacteria bacterium REEB65]|nr:hypothetical protein [Cyanobacteria bacterium REEB65]
MNIPVLFWAELRREFILVMRYPFETISRMVWNLGFSLLIFFGFNAIGGAAARSLPGFEQGQVGRLLGLLITFIAMNGLNNAVELLAEETQTGTLEQAALSPPPLLVIVLLRDLASLVEMLIRFVVVMAIAMALTGVRFHLDIPALAVLLVLMYLGMEGIGLLLGGATLLYKRVATLNQFTVMLVFGLAIFPLEGLPRPMAVFVREFPFTKALILVRQVAIAGKPFGALWASGAVVGLVLNTIGYLGLGALGFALAERTARRWGTLNQY